MLKIFRTTFKIYEMKYWINFLLVLLTTTSAFAQDPSAVEMADVMHSNGKIYVVVAVVMIIFLGIVVNMIRLEKKMNKIEKEQNA